MMAMSWSGPVALPLARLHALLGQEQRSQQLFEDAIARMDSLGARAHCAWVRYHRARFLQPHARTAAAQDLEKAEEDAEALRLHGLCERIQNLRAETTLQHVTATPPRSAPPAQPPILTREGSLFRLSCGNESWLLGDTKGMHMLWQLLAEPGRAIHVLRHPFWAKHECMSAYVHGAELALRGEDNVYAAAHYLGLNQQATPKNRRGAHGGRGSVPISPAISPAPSRCIAVDG